MGMAMGENFLNLLEGICSVLPADMADAIADGYIECLDYDFASDGEQPAVREATRDEFMRVMSTLDEDQLVTYYGHASEDNLASFRSRDARVWDNHLHAYTHDGNQLLVTIPNADGSAYIYAAYVEPTARGTGIASLAMRKCIEDHPGGLCLHTHVNNRRVRALCRHYGFTEVPCGYPNMVFLTNREGIRPVNCVC